MLDAALRVDVFLVHARTRDQDAISLDLAASEPVGFVSADVAARPAALLRGGGVVATANRLNAVILLAIGKDLAAPASSRRLLLDVVCSINGHIQTGRLRLDIVRACR